MQFADHAHDFNPLECGVRRFRGFEAEHRTNAALDGTVVGFDLVIEIFHLAVIDGVVQQLRVFNFRMASPYAGLRSVLMTEGAQSRRARKALARNQVVLMEKFGGGGGS